MIMSLLLIQNLSVKFEVLETLNYWILKQDQRDDDISMHKVTHIHLRRHLSMKQAVLMELKLGNA
jgi:hypothetical protein